MHQTRKESTTKLPIQRKGTKYIARAASHLNNAVPVVIAVRDMLKLARTAKEVKKMIQGKILKINGRAVKDYRESIKLFNIFEAGKVYELSLLPTKKFALLEVKGRNMRVCKVINKRLVSKGIFQLNLHDGSNVLTKEKIAVGDSLYLDFEGKIKKHIPLAKGKEVFIFSGKHLGNKATVDNLEDKKIIINLDGGTAEISNSSVIAL